jgi:hypothetical protein
VATRFPDATDDTESFEDRRRPPQCNRRVPNNGVVLVYPRRRHHFSFSLSGTHRTPRTETDMAMVESGGVRLYTEDTRPRWVKKNRAEFGSRCACDGLASPRGIRGFRCAPDPEFVAIPPWEGDEAVLQGPSVGETPVVQLAGVWLDRGSTVPATARTRNWAARAWEKKKNGPRRSIWAQTQIEVVFFFFLFFLFFNSQFELQNMSVKLVPNLKFKYDFEFVLKLEIDFNHTNMVKFVYL